MPPIQKCSAKNRQPITGCNWDVGVPRRAGDAQPSDVGALHIAGDALCADVDALCIDVDAGPIAGDGSRADVGPLCADVGALCADVGALGADVGASSIAGAEGRTDRREGR